MSAAGLLRTLDVIEALAWETGADPVIRTEDVRIILAEED